MKITVLTIVTLDTPLLHDIQTIGGRKLFIEHFNMSPYRRLVSPPANLHLGFKCVQFSLGKIFTSSYSESRVILDKSWQRWQKTALSNSVTPCHLHLLLSVLFSESRIEKNCYSSRRQEPDSRSLSQKTFQVCFPSSVLNGKTSVTLESHDSWWHESEQNKFRWPAGPWNGFQMSSSPYWIKLLILWANLFMIYAVIQLLGIQTMNTSIHFSTSNFYSSLKILTFNTILLNALTHGSTSTYATNDYYKDTKIFVVSQVAKLL